MTQLAEDIFETSPARGIGALSPTAIYRDISAPVLEASVAGDDDAWPNTWDLARRLLLALSEQSDTQTPLTRRTLDLAGELQVAIDREVGRQLAVVMTHPRFLNLKSVWFGLVYLIDTQQDYPCAELEIHIADCATSELADDLHNDNRLTQSWFFKQLCEKPLDVRGAKPFGLVVSGMSFGGDDDCSASHVPSRQWSRDTCGGLSLLKRIALVAEASHCPFIAAASPLLLGLYDFSYFPDPEDIQISASAPLGAPLNSQTLADAWKQLRQLPESRFIGLVAPRLVLDKPLASRAAWRAWFDWPARNERPQELETARLSRKPLLASGAYAVAAVVIRSMMQTGWPSDIQGVFGCDDPQNHLLEAAGLVNLRGDSFATDPRGVCVRAPVEVSLTGQQERRLGQLGLIALSRVSYTDRVAFYTLRMAHQPTYSKNAASNSTQELHSILPYLLTASRFAHYAKVYLRGKHGLYESADKLKFELEDLLLGRFKGSNLPLRDAQVRVVDDGDGKYRCELALSPRLAAEDVDISGVITLRVMVGKPHGALDNVEPTAE